MYIRQLKQYLRANDKSIEEPTAGQGALLDLARACQREGILRLERDRRGQMRVFPGPALTEGATPVISDPTMDDGRSTVDDRRMPMDDDSAELPADSTAVLLGFPGSVAIAQPMAEEVNGNVMTDHVEPAAAPRARRARKPSASAAGTRKRAARKSATHKH